MKQILTIIFLLWLSINLHGQDSFYERLSSSAIELTKPITNNALDYFPGDIVCWNLGGAVTHIGIVVNKKSIDGKRYQIVHNIGRGQMMEDCLFDFKIIGHYRYQK